MSDCTAGVLSYFFFFKQKTAYEMRISDWSSDVCSSDLVNLSYLLLAQRMLRDDYAASMFRLGFSNEVADILMRLSPAQLVKLAGSSSLLCRFRFDDYSLLSALTQDVLGGALQQAHATILLAKQPVEQLA